MLFRMLKGNEVGKVVTEVFPDRMHVAETEKYFTKGLEDSALTLNDENGMPTV